MTKTGVNPDWCSEFKENLKAFAEERGDTLDQAAAAWRAYSNDCIFFDQSALFSEFKEWVGNGAYKEELSA